MPRKSKDGEELAMKKSIIILIASGLMAVAGPISAADQKANTNEKELCVLYANDCAKKVYDIQKKIGKIQNELAKGSTVYSLNFRSW